MKKAFAIFAALGASVASLPTAAHAATTVTVTCTTNTFSSSACNANQTATGGSETLTVALKDGPEFFINAVPNNAGSANPLIKVDFSNGILRLDGLGSTPRTISSTILKFASSTNPFTSITATGGLGLGATIANGVLTLDLRQTSWNENQFAQFAVTSVPEPGTWMLMMLGLGAVGFSMRRSQKAKPNFQFA